MNDPISTYDCSINYSCAFMSVSVKKSHNSMNRNFSNRNFYREKFRKTSETKILYKINFNENLEQWLQN